MRNNHLIIENNKILSKPEYLIVDIKKEYIYITISNDCDLEIMYQQNQPLHIIYHIKKNIHVSMIETKQINHTFTKEMLIEDDSSVALFSYNDSTKNHLIHENYSLYQNSLIETAYCDLENHNSQYQCTYDLLSPGASAKIRLATFATKQNIKQFDFTLNHKSKYTSGQMDNYGIVKDEAKMIINGFGRIEQGQSQSETHQTSKIIIFDETCKAEANPYLYIDEYDVKASHAASVGKMDQEHLYYLQSRGLNHHEAMQLITLGYVMPVVDLIKNEGIKEQFIERLQRKIGD